MAWRPLRVVLALIVTVLCLAQGCVGMNRVRGSGRVVEESRDITGFTGVRLTTLGDLHIEVGRREALRINAEDNLIRYFVSEVGDGMLTIGTREGINLDPRRPVVFYLTVKDLDTVEVAGSGDVEVPSLKGPRLSLAVLGSGDIEAENLEVGRVEMRLAGSGNVEIWNLQANSMQIDISSSGGLSIAGGQAKRQDLVIGGSGGYAGERLETVETVVDIRGNGWASVWARERLTVNLRGSGQVRYTGDPVLEQTVTGPGGVTRIED